MNIFQKIKLINKVSKIVKEIKKFLNATRLDEEIKEDIQAIIKAVQDLVKKCPQLKEAYFTTLDILK